MDTSEQYIKMSDCEEIQEQARGEHGYFVCGEHHLDMTNDIIEYFQHMIKNKEKRVWLPTQDRLQEMLQPCGFGVMLWDFHAFASILIRDENITSMEQLWLAFVMKEKYNKTWDGNEWVAGS